MRRTIFAVSMGVLFVVGCADKAKPDFDKCVAADTAGDLTGAVAACSAAIGADPTSTSGKAAADKIPSLKEKIAAKEKAEADAKAQADAARAKAEAEAAAKAKAAAVPPETSMCADLDTWLAPLATQADALNKIVPRFSAAAHTANTHKDTDPDHTLMKAFCRDMAKEAAASGKETRQQQATVKKHAVLKGEQVILKDVVEAYNTTAQAYEKYSRLFLALPDSDALDEINKFGDVMKGLPKLRQDEREGAHATCSALSK